MIALGLLVGFLIAMAGIYVGQGRKDKKRREYPMLYSPFMEFHLALKRAALSPQGLFEIRRNRFEADERRRRKEFDRVKFKYKHEHHTYMLLQHEVDTMDVSRKLDFIPFWVEYKTKWALEAKEADLKYGHPMCFEVFIANNL